MIHVSLFDLKVRTPAGAAVLTQVPHLPFAGRHLRGSLTSTIGRAAPPTAWEDGYRAWRQAFDEGRAGVFTAPVSRSLDDLEAAVGRVQRRQ